MGEFAHIAVWVLGSAAVCMMVGYYVGSTGRESRAEKRTDHERKAALAAMMEVLRAVESLTADVDSRNVEIREVGRHVGDLKVSGEMEHVRQMLLAQVSSVLKSNQRLEHDLCHARSRMEQQSAELDRTRREALTDGLSGAANRKAFDERLRLMMADFNLRQTPFVLVLADLDHFKWINDTHGHLIGDRVLVEFANVLKSNAREQDYVARIGGDEFAVLLPNTTIEEGQEVSHRMLTATQQSPFRVGRNMEMAALTASFGLTAAREDDTCETMLHRGDQALYRSKNSGRNQVQMQRLPGEVVELIEDEEVASSA